MDCNQFLSRYTDFRDGRLSPEERESCESHLSACSSCARYERVVDRGVQTLRTASTLRVGEDFLPRLQHRIYHMEDGEILVSDGSRASGVTALATVGVAVLLAVAAWTPVLRQAETVRLPAMVVTGPAGGPRADLQLPPSAFFRAPDPDRTQPIRRGAANLTWSPSATSLASWTRSPAVGSGWSGRAVSSPGASYLGEVRGSPSASGLRIGGGTFLGATSVQGFDIGLD